MFWRNMIQFILGLVSAATLIFTNSCSSTPEPVAVATKKIVRGQLGFMEYLPILKNGMQ